MRINNCVTRWPIFSLVMKCLIIMIPETRFKARVIFNFFQEERLVHPGEKTFAEKNRSFRERHESDRTHRPDAFHVFSAIIKLNEIFFLNEITKTIESR